MSFFKTFLASVLGTFLALFLILLVLTAGLMSSSSQPEPYLQEGTVLTIDLSGTIPARTIQDPLQELLSGPQRSVSLERLKESLEKAASDDRIAGVWITASRITTSWATLESARDYLEQFREESDKFLYFTTNDIGMNESAYFLASAADSIFFPPETYFEFNGFAIQTSYYSELLDMIGIDPEIIRAGSYKSAVEPFLRTDSSPENREQLTAILNSVSDTFRNAVSSGRGLSPEQIDRQLNELPENSIEYALDTGLIDGIAYRHEVEQIIQERLQFGEEDELHTTSIARYSRVSASSAGLSEPSTDNRIAVIHASGMIVPSSIETPFSSGPMITDRNIRESLEDALENDQVKSIVIHIDSGGGATSTSELIYKQIREAAKKKPVVAYLGNVAASGGYYIAMGANQVISSPNTITGSIGVYNMMFNTSSLYNDHLGIFFETFKTHDHADMNVMTRPLTDGERMAVRRRVESTYDRFLDIVSESRGMNRNEVHEVAQGRVWTGQDASQRGLVDQLGDLQDAVVRAAELAEIEEYRLLNYPKPKDLFQVLFQSADASVRSWLSDTIPFYGEHKQVEDLVRHHANRNWAVMPVKFHIQ